MSFLLITIVLLTTLGAAFLASPRLRLAGLAGLMSATTLAVVHAFLEA
jgi:hypothetical protein